MGIDFGKFARVNDISKQKLEAAANQVKEIQKNDKSVGSKPDLGDRKVNTDSIFTNSSTGKVSSQNFIEQMSGKSIDELDKAQKAQYQLISAFADVDGDEKISEEEAKNLDVSGDGKISQEDIDKIYEELGIGTDESIDVLMEEIDKMLSDKTKVEEHNGIITTESGKVYATEKGSPAENSGAKLNDDGEYVVTIEQYRGGKVQDDGNGGMRYPNGSYWGIVTNAYPDATEAQKAEIYDYIAKLNGFEDGGYQSHGLYAGDTLKLPVLEYDENGNITGMKEKASEATEEDKDAELLKNIPTHDDKGFPYTDEYRQKLLDEYKQKEALKAEMEAANIPTHDDRGFAYTDEYRQKLLDEHNQKAEMEAAGIPTHDDKGIPYTDQYRQKLFDDYKQKEALNADMNAAGIPTHDDKGIPYTDEYRQKLYNEKTDMEAAGIPTHDDKGIPYTDQYRKELYNEYKQKEALNADMKAAGIPTHDDKGIPYTDEYRQKLYDEKKANAEKESKAKGYDEKGIAMNYLVDDDGSSKVLFEDAKTQLENMVYTYHSTNAPGDKKAIEDFINGCQQSGSYTEGAINTFKKIAANI